MLLKKINKINRNKINEFVISQWFSDKMIIHGEIIDLNQTEGYYFQENNKIIALITYRIINNELEILSLDSLYPNRGIGTKLLNKIKAIAKKNNCSSIKLITTNDNLNALRFYQKRGFVISNIYLDSIKESRKLKPQIPLIGNYDILIRDEIELKLSL